MMDELLTDEEAVLEANRRFYAALTALDLLAMEAVWLHKDWVHCVHPGWELMMGWEKVRESWETIFQGTEGHVVKGNAVDVHVTGALAWVICIERIDTASDRVLTLATNLFEKTSGEWLMVHHHASILPFASLDEPTGPVH